MLFYEENFQELLKNSVTAVFAVSDFYALEFMRFLQGKGIQIPNDIQIIGFDDNMASRESNPTLTTIHQEASLRAKIAIECLEAMRDGAECETEIVLLENMSPSAMSACKPKPTIPTDTLKWPRLPFSKVSCLPIT